MHSDEFLLDHSIKWDFSTIFNNSNPVICEIGFGMGDALVNMAQQNQDVNFWV